MGECAERYLNDFNVLCLNSAYSGSDRLASALAALRECLHSSAGMHPKSHQRRRHELDDERISIPKHRCEVDVAFFDLSLCWEMSPSDISNAKEQSMDRGGPGWPNFSV